MAGRPHADSPLERRAAQRGLTPRRDGSERPTRDAVRDFAPALLACTDGLDPRLTASARRAAVRRPPLVLPDVLRVDTLARGPDTAGIVGAVPLTRACALVMMSSPVGGLTL